jgi:hypothetical protein
MSLRWCEGTCAIRAEGLIDGLLWYFRARGSSWHFHVAQDRRHLFQSDLFHCEVEWDSQTLGSSGFMSPADVLKCLHSGAMLYRQQENRHD